MNKRMWGLVASMALCFLIAHPASYADDGSTDSASTLEDIKTYIYNLGLNTGFELDPAKATQPNPPVNTLITTPNDTTDQLKLMAQYAFNGIFGAIPVNTFFFEFLPTDSKVEAISPYIEPLNALANDTFPAYDKPDSTPLSVSELIDQETYQLDPVNQALLDILTTPDNTYCMANDGIAWKTEECTLLYQSKVVSNVVGTLPATDSYFTYDYQSQFLSDLNGNNLIAPLLYTTTPGTAKPEEGAGLLGQNQVESAANFIRYVSGAVQPMPTIKWADYNTQLSAAYKKPAGDKETDAERTARENALTSLAENVTSVRMYAAKSSVATSNLYYILSQRLPQKDLGDSSRAFNEFQMATRRQYDPTKGATQWMDSINTASPATVQKEMAILLSEINYQLYLNRQLDERQLLTNTLLLVNSIALTKPSTTLTMDEE